MRILLLFLLLASSPLHAQERARLRARPGAGRLSERSTQAPRALAGPAAARFSEGSTHGFLELRADNDSVIGSGTLLQVPKDKFVESRLILSFHDGSRFEETTRYTQHPTF